MPDIRNSRFDRLRRREIPSSICSVLYKLLASPATTTTTTTTMIMTLLPPERAAFRQPSLSSRRLAQDRRAAAADDDRLRVREDGRDREAAGALDVHEEGARGGHEGLR